MKKNESIPNKFSDFEPYVDEFTIDKSWEKIKYFVPQKEKKRRLFFLLPIFYIPLVTFLFYITGINPLYKTQSVQKHTNHTEVEEQEIHRSTTKSKIKPKQKTLKSNSLRSTLNSVFPEKIGGFPTFHLPSPKKSGTVLPQDVKSLSNTQSELSTYATKPSPESKIQFFDTLLNKNELSEPLVCDYLQPICIYFPDSSKLNRTVILKNIDWAFSHKKTKRLSVDVAGGVQNSFTQIKHESENIEHSNTGLNYLFGMGVNYKIKKRLYLTGQVIGVKNNKIYEERFTGNHVVKKYQMSPTHVSSDTTYYVKTNSLYYLKSNYKFNLGLGFEYALLQKNKITLNAALLLNTMVANYKYSISKSSEKDTLIHVGPYSNTGTNSTGSSNFKEGRSEVSKKNIDLGIMPGFALGYKLNSKATLIFKSSFFLNLSPLKSEDSGSELSIKQNDLFLQLGIRFTP